MQITTNKNSLPVKAVIGEIAPSTVQGFGLMAMDPDGKGHYRVQNGGITYNYRLGDSCMGLTGENLQPGISTKGSGAYDGMTYGFYCCVGNEVTIAAGPLSGKKGFVTGKVTGAGITVDFDNEIVQQMCGDERFYIKACGVGLAIDGEENVALHNMDPAFFEKLNVTKEDDTYLVNVKTVLPGYLVGPAIGGSVITNCAEIMSDHGPCDEEFGLNNLCVGDIVAITDLDTTSGRTVYNGAVTIGVIVSGDSITLGGGPGIMTIMSSRATVIKPVLCEEANIKNYIDIK